jgi:outer membrane protein OmpA-like peptidoglycan-associated protein
LDSDGDGIVDKDDACPQDPAPPETAQASRGCPAARVEQGQITIAEQIQFKRGTAELSAESADILQAVAKVLNEHPEITLLGVEGHTDSSGKSAINGALSAERAQAVRERLIKYGVAPERLKHAGFGDAKPIASNDDEAGRARNRRVQFVILSSSGEASRPPR